VRYHPVNRNCNSNGKNLNKVIKFVFVTEIVIILVTVLTSVIFVQIFYNATLVF
jgi:hypothetical protein